MKIILADVISLDGKLTKWENGQPAQWTSPEEQTHFHHLLHSNNLIAMGSNLFKQQNVSPREGTLKIILTRHPQKYQTHQIPNQLEFTNQSPQDLISSLETRGYTQMLFVGGPQLATQFIEKNLIDELWLTLEPQIFGQGLPMVTQKLDLKLHLYHQEPLNPQGTLFLKYKIVK